VATTQHVAQAHYRAQKQLAAGAARTATQQWGLLDPDRLTESWAAGVGQTVLATTSQAQLAAAQQAPLYLAELAEAQGATLSAPLLIASTLSGTASDGRPLASLLYLPIILVESLLADGMNLLEAFRRGRNMLALHVATQVADAGRAAVSVGMTANKRWVTYVRQVNLPACSRCIILAGRQYSWSTGFLRHPRCDCTMTPRLSTDQAPGPSNPEDLFERMSREQQNKAFSQAGAEAIRDGADIGQVVNARRGMQTAGGRLVTTEGTTRRGVAGRKAGTASARRSPVRPMPEQLYKDAGGDRDLAISLLKRHGFIL
jgi:hypothetical protein